MGAGLTSALVWSLLVYVTMSKLFMLVLVFTVYRLLLLRAAPQTSAPRLGLECRAARPAQPQPADMEQEF